DEGGGGGASSELVAQLGGDLAIGVHGVVVFRRDERASFGVQALIHPDLAGMQLQHTHEQRTNERPDDLELALAQRAEGRRIEPEAPEEGMQVADPEAARFERSTGRTRPEGGFEAPVAERVL